MSESRSPDPSPDGSAISRRQVLVGALGAVAAGGVIVATAGPSSAAPLTRPPKASPHPVYRRSRFAPRVGTVVPVADPAGARLRLEGVGDISDGRRGIADGHEHAFSLRFRQVNGPVLAQGTYTLAFPGFGPVALFLVPVGQPDRRRYEAVVNRLITG
jgi:hypothetical protein